MMPRACFFVPFFLLSVKSCGLCLMPLVCLQKLYMCLVTCVTKCYTVPCILCTCMLYIMYAVCYVLYMCLMHMKRVMCIVCCMYCVLAA